MFTVVLFNACGTRRECRVSARSESQACARAQRECARLTSDATWRPAAVLAR